MREKTFRECEIDEEFGLDQHHIRLGEPILAMFCGLQALYEGMGHKPTRQQRLPLEFKLW
ncbi:MAG TPA: hypothetical protein PK098_06405 [Phycisphaerales bacterium]|nr:hypothetical protein [Phycisphaerales bacterium]